MSLFSFKNHFHILATWADYWIVPLSFIRAETGSRYPIRYLPSKNDALEWLAAMCSHVPNKGEQMVRYYGYYSNVCRGRRQKGNQDGLIPCILEANEDSRGYRKNWAKLIKKIYEVDPLNLGTATIFY